jgi:hypothetical protein
MCQYHNTRYTGDNRVELSTGLVVTSVPPRPWWLTVLFVVSLLSNLGRPTIVTVGSQVSSRH